MSQPSIELSGRNALVTGAGSGVGRDIAIALAEAGAVVAVNDLNIERAEAVVAQIEAGGGAGIALGADISNRFAVANMIERARDAFGRPHILVNAVGISKSEALLAIDEWDWRRQIEVNLTGAFFCTQLLGRVLADEGGGRIINLAPKAALNSSILGRTAYVASKAGLIALTRQTAAELYDFGIRVNAVVGRDNAAIAKTTLHLCSDAAGELTGEVIDADRDAAADDSFPG